MTAYRNTGLSSTSLHKVVIILQDHDTIGKVYVKINGSLTAKDILIEAMTSLETGNIYSDIDCNQLIDYDFIEMYNRHPTKRKDENFIFLIQREFAQDYIVSAKILR
jgi:hypothetical protein